MEFAIKRKSDDELKHYGIPGQVHGIRNYQYENGTLTPAGKERYAKMRQEKSSGGNQHGNGPAGMRSRQINVASDKVAEVKKTEAVGGSGEKPWFIIPGLISLALGTKSSNGGSVIPSDREYNDMKKEFDKDEWVGAYDLDNNSYLHVRKDELGEYADKLREQGINTEIPTIDKPDATPEEKAEIKKMNAQIRYWNETIKDASGQKEVPLMTQDITPAPKPTMKRDAEAAKRLYSNLSDKEKKQLKEATKKAQNGKPLRSAPVGTATHGDESDELMHDGIKGMHWYERRFQYENGKLTPEGKERYAKMRKERKAANQDAEGYHDPKEARAKIAENALNRRKTAAHQYDGKGVSGLSEGDREKAIANGDFSAWCGGIQNKHSKPASYQQVREELSLDELQKLLTTAFDEDTLKSDVNPAYWPFQLSDDLKFTVTDEEKRQSEWTHKENERIMWNNMIDELKSDEKYKDQLDDLMHRLKYAQISYEMFYGSKSAPVLRPNGGTDMYQDSHQLPMSDSERKELIAEWHANNPDPKKYTYPYDRMKVSKDYKPEAKGSKEYQEETEYNSKKNSFGHSDELMHYGVLGMKWGIRRYQKEDGSLTKEGKAHYANNEAYEIGKKATVTGYAAQIAQKRADKQNVKLEKAKTKGNQSAIDKAQAKADVRNKVAKDLWEEYDKYVKQGEEHIGKLIEEFGEENVKGFNYRENKSKSLTGPDKLVNERTMNGVDIAAAAGKTIAANIVMRMAGIPAVAIYTPPSGSQLGRQMANERLKIAKTEQKREQQRAKVDAQSPVQKQQVRSDHPYYTKQERSEAKIRANEKDVWNLNFLEAVQNKTYANGTDRDPQKKKRMMQEYDAFLRDPVNYRPPEGDEE